MSFDPGFPLCSPVKDLPSPIMNSPLSVSTVVLGSEKYASGTSNNFRQEQISISNNSEAPLSHPADQTDGTIAIFESEQLPNGLYRNVSRTIIARTDVATVTDSTEISDAGAGGYLETITKKFNQSSQATISESDTAAGSIVTVENTINDDGTFDTIERIRTERSLTSSAKSIVLPSAE